MTDASIAGTTDTAGAVAPPARALGFAKVVGVLGILVGIALIVLAVVLWIAIAAQLSVADVPFAFDALGFVIFGVPVLAITVGILSILFGWAIHRLASAPVVIKRSQFGEV
ncbi:hypothetical protein [Microbacterium sp.]|uniref:hypothetical protein n=1 Tax=Microbacterium sp. TaxID=51671 RepID=UPI002E34282D|nr:hypothetical protein [Microbacterium sp.]HEX5729896.1 hypothetical protein [Microbacterium sp.]